jgi:hypothetical protein
MATITIGLKEWFSEEGLVPKHFGVICGSIPEGNGSALSIVTDGAPMFFRVMLFQITFRMSF